jgi:hypothetical protein
MPLMEFGVTIEIPAGSRNKYEMDHTRNPPGTTAPATRAGNAGAPVTVPGQRAGEMASAAAHYRIPESLQRYP